MIGITRDICRSIFSRGAVFCFSGMLLLLIAGADGAAQQQNSLSAAIRLFDQGRTDAALSMFNALVEQNPRCPLAYYYAALIRIQQQQYRRAEQNLETALRDSSRLVDAYALMALARREQGNTRGALEAWRQFVRETGTVAEENQQSLESITYPELYREKLAAQARPEQESAARGQATALPVSALAEPATSTQQPNVQEQAASSPAPGSSDADRVTTIRGESSAGNQSAAPSGTGSPAEAVSRNTPPAPSAAVTANTQAMIAAPESTLEEQVISLDDTPLREIETRISADIRTIMITVSAAAGFLLLSIAGIVLWIRKKRHKSDDVVFSEQVELLLDDMKFELSEDRALREFELKKQEIIQELESIRAAAEPKSENPLPARAREETAAFRPEEAISAPAFPVVPGDSKRPLITEEVKALVSRLHREGKPPEQIARVADLTTTEVQLILAIREHRLGDLANRLHENDHGLEPDELSNAVRSLREEGLDSREIARKLDISLSEVSLVTSLLARRGLPQ